MSPATTVPAVEPVRKAVAMFMLIAVVLGVFLTIVVVVALAKRIRRRQEARDTTHAPIPDLPDPWTEAARRVQPFDRREQR